MYLTVAEVAKRLNVSEKLIYKWTKNGSLKSHKFGRLVRIDDKDLQEYEQQSQQKGSPPEVQGAKKSEPTGIVPTVYKFFPPRTASR